MQLYDESRGDNDRKRGRREIHKGTEIKNVFNDLKIAEQVVDFAVHAHLVGHAGVVTEEQTVVVVAEGAEAPTAAHRPVEARYLEQRVMRVQVIVGDDALEIHRGAVDAAAEQVVVVGEVQVRDQTLAVVLGEFPVLRYQEQLATRIVVVVIGVALEGVEQVVVEVAYQPVFGAIRLRFLVFLWIFGLH